MNREQTLKMQDNHNVEMYGSTHVGTRDYQQDRMNMYRADSFCAAIVCDGMGGREHGEKASQYAVDYITNALSHISAEGYINTMLTNAAFEANDAITEFQDASGRPLKAGTTVVTALIAGDGLHIMSVGDSRIYLIRDGKITQLTQDQNYRLRLNELLKLGLITQPEYDKESKRAEALISFLGVGEPIMVDTKGPYELLQNDIILLCSDGLYKGLSNDAINNIVNSNIHNVADIPDELIKAARQNTAAGMDNTTVVIMRYTLD